MKSHHRLALNFGLTALWFVLAIASMPQDGRALAGAVLMSVVSMFFVNIFTR